MGLLKFLKRGEQLALPEAARQSRRPVTRREFLGRLGGSLSCLAVLGRGSSALASPSVAEAQALEYRIKAAYLYNFGRFVEWPRNTGEDSPFVIGVLGDNPFGAVLDETVRDKRVRGRRIRVRQVSAVADASDCDLLFISSSERRHIGRIVRDLRGSSVLTVGEADSFLDEGGMLNFVIERSTVRFEIDLDAVREAGLDVSSQLLKVARDVRFERK